MKLMTVTRSSFYFLTGFECYQILTNRTTENGTQPATATISGKLNAAIINWKYLVSCLCCFIFNNRLEFHVLMIWSHACFISKLNKGPSLKISNQNPVLGYLMVYIWIWLIWYRCIFYKCVDLYLNHYCNTKIYNIYLWTMMKISQKSEKTNVFLFQSSKANITITLLGSYDWRIRISC